MESKYKGIDSRKIKCSNENPNTIEAGISFDVFADDKNYLMFHFLTYTYSDELRNETELRQVSKAMQLNKENTKQLIKELRSLKF